MGGIGGRRGLLEEELLLGRGRYPYRHLGRHRLPLPLGPIGPLGLESELIAPSHLPIRRHELPLDHPLPHEHDLMSRGEDIVVPGTGTPGAPGLPGAGTPGAPGKTVVSAGFGDDYGWGGL